jgi:predicted nucleic acid-binding protein
VKLVLDASVALKWFLPDADEHHRAQANAVLWDAARGAVDLVQPPHFLAEVAAVLTRKRADTAHRDLVLLRQLPWETADDAATFRTAIELAARFDRHLFDTLYHAAALEQDDALFLTADERYIRSVRGTPRVRSLSEWPASAAP